MSDAQAESDQRHGDAWADTSPGDDAPGAGYSLHHGWSLSCLWCGYTAEGHTKADVVDRYKQEHEDSIIARLRSTSTVSAPDSVNGETS